jgi:hypothetical protein
MDDEQSETGATVLGVDRAGSPDEFRIAASYARQAALQIAHNPEAAPHDVIARAKAYADFVLGTND